MKLKLTCALACLICLGTGAAWCGKLRMYSSRAALDEALKMDEAVRSWSGDFQETGCEFQVAGKGWGYDEIRPPVARRCLFPRHVVTRIFYGHFRQWWYLPLWLVAAITGAPIISGLVAIGSGWLLLQKRRARVAGAVS